MRGRLLVTLSSALINCQIRTRFFRSALGCCSFSLLPNKTFAAMDDIEIKSIQDVHDSKYIRPKRVVFKQNGLERTWDYYRQHDSVVILIFDVTKQAIVMVKQFRPSVYMTKIEELKEKGSENEKLDPAEGITFELCAGIVDRSGPVVDIACAEVLEETGYKVSPDKMEFVTKYRSVGISGATQFFFYVEVEESQKVSEGGGLADEGEMIDVYFLPVDKVQQFVDDPSIENRPGGALFALTWFLRKKMKN